MTKKTDEEKEIEIRDKCLELIKFYFDEIYPYILKYTTLLFTLGIDPEKEKISEKKLKKKIKKREKKKIDGAPKQLDYYKTDAFHDIAFSLYDDELTYNERIEKIAHAKEHIILNGTEYIEFYATKKLEYINKRIRKLKKWYRVRFFPKSIIYFDYRYIQIQENEWSEIKKQKSVDFKKCRIILEKFIDDLKVLHKEFYEEPVDNQNVIVYNDELKRYEKIRKWFYRITGFGLTALITPLIVAYYSFLFFK